MFTYVIMMSHFPNLHVSLCSFCSICVHQGDAPLPIAALKGHKDIVELLIKCSANVNAQGGILVCCESLHHFVCIDAVVGSGLKGGSGNVRMNSFSFLHFELLGNHSIQLIVI